MISGGKATTPAASDLKTKSAKDVPTFSQFNPKAFKAMKDAFVMYIKHISALEKGTDAGAKTATAFSINDVKLDKAGVPRVPDPIRNVNNIETNVTQQQIIRGYLTKHYSL